MKRKKKLEPWAWAVVDPEGRPLRVDLDNVECVVYTDKHCAENFIIEYEGVAAKLDLIPLYPRFSEKEKMKE